MSTRSTGFIRLGAIGVAAALATAAMVVPTSVASASGYPAISVYCLSLGHSRFECQLTINGGTPPYTTTWWPQNNAGPWEFTATDFAVGTCIRPLQNTVMAVVVVDSAGAASLTGATFYCGDAE